MLLCVRAFSVLTRLGGRKGIQPVKNEWWGAGMVVCLERVADLHMAQLMPLPLTVSCFSKMQVGFTFLVPAHPGCPGKGPLNGRVCVCYYVSGINSCWSVWRTAAAELFVRAVVWIRVVKN